VDQPLDEGYRRRRQLKRWGLGVAALGVLALLIGWVPGLVRPSIRLGDVRTSRVDTGPLDASLAATGTVVPEIEQVIASPVDARVLKILKRAGTAVRRGEPLVQLDVKASELAADTLAQDMAIRANQQARARLALEGTLAGLSAQVEIQRLRLESSRLQHVRNQQLFAEGLVSKEVLLQSEVAESEAVIELKRLEASRRNAEQTTRTELEGLALEMNKLRNDSVEASRVLELATARADRDGVVTWTLTEEGAQVRQGDVVARLADLGSFRVDAAVSDVHASRLSVGLPVVVRVGEAALEGAIANILPTIQNGVVTVAVSLADKSNDLLRSNLRVDVAIVTGHRDRALRLRKGPSTGGEGLQQVFVLRGDRAVRTPVRFGISSFDFVEVVEGLAEGDTAIVSDMSDYQHLRDIRVR
jgi:HlyD family secretion protein